MVPALSAALRAPARLVGRGRALHATAARGAGSGGLFEDATALVGNTPVVKISDKLAPPGVEVYAKCEYFNPLASVKDRLAVAICVEIKVLRRVRPESPRRPPRHRRDACSMAWRCRLLAARPSQDGAPNALVDFHTGRDHRGRGEARRTQARDDGGRGHVRQHGHRGWPVHKSKVHGAFDATPAQ